MGTLNSHILGTKVDRRLPRRRYGKVICIQIPHDLYKQSKARAKQDAMNLSSWIRRCMAVEARRKI